MTTDEHKIRFSKAWEIVCVCGLRFGSNQDAAVQHCRRQESIARRENKVKGLRQRRMESLPRTTRQLVSEWGISRSAVRQYLLRHGAKRRYIGRVIVWCSTGRLA